MNEYSEEEIEAYRPELEMSAPTTDEVLGEYPILRTTKPAE